MRRPEGIRWRNSWTWRRLRRKGGALPSNSPEPSETRGGGVLRRIGIKRRNGRRDIKQPGGGAAGQAARNLLRLVAQLFHRGSFPRNSGAPVGGRSKVPGEEQKDLALSRRGRLQQGLRQRSKRQACGPRRTRRAWLPGPADTNPAGRPFPTCPGEKAAARPRQSRRGFRLLRENSRGISGSEHL